MAAVFKLLLSFTIFVRMCLTQSVDIDAHYSSTDLPTNVSVSVQCLNTWQFFNTSSKKCECGSRIHEAVLCNDTTNDVDLLNCHCMTLNTKTGKFEAGKCFIGCAYTRMWSHIYNPVPRDPSKVNEWMCKRLNKNGTMCGNCLQSYR